MICIVFVRHRIAAAEAGQSNRAANLRRKRNSRVRTNHTVLINNFNSDIDQVVPVRFHRGFLRQQADLRRRPGCFQHSPADFLPVRIADGLNRSGRVRSFKPHAARQWPFAANRFPPDGLPVHQHLDFLRARENHQFQRFSLRACVVPSGKYSREPPRADQLRFSVRFRRIGVQKSLPVPPNHASVVPLRRPSSGDVKIGVVGGPPGERRRILRHQGPWSFFQQRISFRQGYRFANAGLPQIVPRRPREIADHIVQFLNQRPPESDFLREVLRSENHPLRKHLVILFIKLFHIVVADDIQPVGEGLGSFFPKVLHSLVPGVLRLVHAPGQLVVQSAPEGADPVADRPGSVQIPDGFRQFFCQGISVVQSAALWNLISRGP